MLALEIKINNSAPMMIAADNHVVAIFSYGVLALDPDNSLITGFDEFNNYIWLDEKIHHGDEIHIRVVDIDKDKVSVPLKIKTKNLGTLKKEIRESQARIKRQRTNMKGIIIKSHIAEKVDVTKVAIPNGIATVAVNVESNIKVFWGAGAMTMPEGRGISWNGGRMKVGDSICLKFTDIDEPDTPASKDFITACMESASIEDIDSSEWQFKLERYNKLKSFLENKHMI